MKKLPSFLLSFFVIILSSMLLTSCQAIGDIFGAGVYVGVFLVIFVIIIIVVIISKLSGGSKQ